MSNSMKGKDAKHRHDARMILQEFMERFTMTALAPQTLFHYNREKRREQAMRRIKGGKQT